MTLFENALQGGEIVQIFSLFLHGQEQGMFFENANRSLSYVWFTLHLFTDSNQCRQLPTFKSRPLDLETNKLFFKDSQTGLKIDYPLPQSKVYVSLFA